MPDIHLEPAVALLDAPRHITLSGFAPHARIKVTATSRQTDNVVWQSHAVFLADAAGVVDTATAAPVEGDYQGADGQGLLWAQHPQSALPPEAATLPPEILAGEPVLVRIDASDGAVRAQATLTQAFARPGVVRREIREQGLVGTLYIPATEGPHPAIVILNGSGGGINETAAALYASHGYAAFALGYFGAPGLPTHISQTPLEYFERGLQWLRQTVRPAYDFVAVSGQSRGGELSLLLGATYPDLVSAVLAYVPSSVVHGVLNAGRPGEGRYAPCWIHQGKPVPHVWEDNAATDWSAIDSLPQPRRQAQAFVNAQRDARAVARARIPVERIAGPVALVSGGDDGYWPSTEYCREIEQALHAVSHPYPVLRLDYPEAGHGIQPPFVPTTEIAKAHAVSGIVLTGGGTAEANNQANVDSWPRLLDFLSAAVTARADRVA